VLAARAGSRRSTSTSAVAATKAATKKSAPAKKAAAKKAAPAKKTAKKAAKSTSKKVSPLVVKEGESAWTKAEIKEVRSELTSIRDKVAATLAAQEEELAGLMRDAGDGAGHDQADMGATSFERDHELTVVNNEREKLAQIDRALARIADGSYGICESCGNPIGKMRVMAFPRATLCLTCKQREERR
jgi:DnaK suppressor protein